MRIIEMKKVIEDNLGTIESTMNKKADASGWIFITNYDSFLKSLGNIRQTGIIDDEFNTLESQSFFALGTNSEMKLSNDRYKKFIVSIKRIITKCEAILLLVESNYSEYEESEDTLVVKLPEMDLSVNHFFLISKSLNNSMKFLNDANLIEKNDIKIKSFDKGSNLLLICVGTVAIIQIISAILTGIQQYQRNSVSNKFIEDSLITLKKEQEEQQQFLSTLREINQQKILEICETIMEKISPDNEDELQKNSEAINSLAKAFEEFKKLNEMGVTFSAGIRADIETVSSFPPVESQKLLNSVEIIEMIKRITDGTNP